MTTLNIHSQQSQAGSFHFEIGGAAAVGALALAMAVCVQHGDFSAIPALLCLTAMAAIVFGVTAPETTSRGDRSGGATSRHTLLQRRHCLEQ